VRHGHDASWRRATVAYREGFQWWRTDEGLSEIVCRNSGYDVPDPWEDLLREITCRRSGAAYTTLQDIYRSLEIGPERQNGQNAKRVTELMAELGWVKARRRIGNDWVDAFFPGHAQREESEIRRLGPEDFESKQPAKKDDPNELASGFWD